MRTQPAQILPACPYCNNDHNPDIQCRYLPDPRGRLNREERTTHMGYSCTRAAGDVLEALQAIHSAMDSSNTFANPVTHKTYFWEIGKERADGAVVGTVEEMLPGDRARPAGRFFIDPLGKIVAFPGMPREHWPNIEQLAARGGNEIERFKRDRRLGQAIPRHAGPPPAHGH